MLMVGYMRVSGGTIKCFSVIVFLTIIYVCNFPSPSTGSFRNTDWIASYIF